MITNEYVGLYFYSTMFQGNMALLALLGVFVVFKRQELLNELQGKDFAIFSFFQNYLDSRSMTGRHVPFNYRDVGDLPNLILDMSNGINVSPNIQEVAKNLHNDPNFRARFDERARIITQRNTVVDLLWFPFGSILLVIILSLILLPLAHFIHTNKPFIELPAIVFSIIINIASLAITTRFIWKVLKD